MINTLVMRPQLLSVVAATVHDQSTPSGWSPSQTPNHGAGSQTLTTVGTYPYIIPYWVTHITIGAWGGGGSGGGGSIGAGGAGGVGGWYAEKEFDVEPGQVLTVTVGADAVCTSEAGPGVDGHNTTVTGVDISVVAPGGKKGNSGSGSTPGAATSGNNGTTPVGTTVHSGGNSGAGVSGADGGGGGSSAGTAANGNAGSDGDGGSGGVGGIAPTGGGDGGNGGPTNDFPFPGLAPGGGGGGATSDPIVGNFPGTGARGRVKISWPSNF